MIAKEKKCLRLWLLLNIVFITISTHAQTVQDDFEGNGTITTWVGDDCGINTDFLNPFQQGINTSETVLEYNDIGGQYANVRFEIAENFDLTTKHVFSLKIYVPSNGLTGNQNQQVSLKLQDGTLGQPWTTQSEIIKPIVLNQWQTVTFDFKNDPFINLDANSPIPIERTDFDRIVIQVNGENNNDHVRAFLDDFSFDSSFPVFDHLIWSDEFNGQGAIDSDKWFHQTQLPAGGSWFNGEIQHYTDRTDNTIMNNGSLKIIAKKEIFTDQGETKFYTSARLNSKFAFKYGRVEVRAKLPQGVGTWPAIWMLGKNITETGAYWMNEGFGTTSWPACGEIDIMEHWGTNQNYVQSATHTPSSFGNTENHGGQVIPTASTDFHVYALEWTPEKLIFSVDGITHYTYNPSIKDENTWPFDAEQYLLLNIAIQPSITPNFTQSSMEIDYVRVYQMGTVSITELEEQQELTRYPNPIDNELNIILDEPTDQNIPLKIYGVDGKLYQSFNQSVNGNKLTINNLGDLTSGIYIVSFELNDRNYTLKIYKK